MLQPLFVMATSAQSADLCGIQLQEPLLADRGVQPAQVPVSTASRNQLPVQPGCNMADCAVQCRKGARNDVTSGYNMVYERNKIRGWVWTRELEKGL